MPCFLRSPDASRVQSLTREGREGAGRKFWLCLELDLSTPLGAIPGMYHTSTRSSVRRILRLFRERQKGRGSDRKRLDATAPGTGR